MFVGRPSFAFLRWFQLFCLFHLVSAVCLPNKGSHFSFAISSCGLAFLCHQHLWFGLSLPSTFVVWSFFAIGICGLFFLFPFPFFVTGICVQFLSYTAFSAVGIRARLTVFAFFLSQCPQMLKSILGTNCDVDRMVPWLRRGPVRVPLFFPKTCSIHWCTGQPSFCLPFGFYFSLGCFH